MKWTQHPTTTDIRTAEVGGYRWSLWRTAYGQPMLDRFRCTDGALIYEAGQCGPRGRGTADSTKWTAAECEAWAETKITVWCASREISTEGV